MELNFKNKESKGGGNMIREMTKFYAVLIKAILISGFLATIAGRGLNTPKDSSLSYLKVGLIKIPNTPP
jgi:hypothetical protein